MSVKRYQPVAQCVEPSYQAQMVEPKVMEFSEGEYVLHSDYAALLAATQWRPIETAPKDGTWIMCHCENQGHIVLRFNSNDGWNNFDTYELRPTHWMPIPKPPSV